MKIAVLSDAHGNKLFFDTCIEEIRKKKPDIIVYLGDIFGYMQGGCYILSKLVSMNAIIIKGNHEAMLLGEIDINDEKDKIYGLKKQMETLANSDLEIISHLPSKYETEIEGKKYLFIHGAPWDYIKGYLYENNHDYGWNDEAYDYIFMGHTHRAFIKKMNGITYINVGACGLPRDNGLEPGYCFGDSDTDDFKIYKVSIDREWLQLPYFENVNPTIMDVFLRKGM